LGFLSHLVSLSTMTYQKKFIAISLFLIAPILLAGCGSSSGSSSSSSSKSANVKTDFTFMSDFLSALKGNGVDCTGYAKDSEVIGVREQGTCMYGSTELTLDIFADEKTAKTMTDSLKSFGGYWVVSNNWVIVVQDGTVAKDLQSKLGASIA